MISIVAEVLLPWSQRLAAFVVCVVLGSFAGGVHHVVFEKHALSWVQRFRPRRQQPASDGQKATLWNSR